MIWQMPLRSLLPRTPPQSSSHGLFSPTLSSPQSTPPGVADLAQTERRLPFSPSTKLSAIFALPRNAATRLFQIKLSASYLLGHPNWHHPEPGLCTQCEAEIESIKHALLCCPAHQSARGSFLETLDLKSAWCDTIATGMLPEFVQRTLAAYPLSSTPPEDVGTPTPPPYSPP